tara:strand:- start:2276 stop:3181 length:906 start_codon:yes stop_codon:yes gene_type:complete
MLTFALSSRAAFVSPSPRSAVGSRRSGSVAMAAGDVLLDVKDLVANVADTQILNGINIEVKRGEVHAIMGPNGSGKSTFSKVLVGHPSYEVTGGSVQYAGGVEAEMGDLFELETEERAQQGVFLAFQYPVEIPGVSNNDFLRLAVNKRRQAKGEEDYDPIEFFGVLSEAMTTVGMKQDFLGRDVNGGFSGGEKKRNEILQMSLLQPSLAILDETDSGLDIDALKTVAEGINTYKSDDNAIILITHYQRLLDYIKPDYVHVMSKGKIVKSGGPELALELEKEGYAFLGQPDVPAFLPEPEAV